jgi:hypothetical protein
MMSICLTSAEWNTAHRLAQSLVADEADHNELGKALAYFRQSGDKTGFLRLLADLSDSRFIRSGRTRGYFRAIARACNKHLSGLTDEQALLVVGWAFRLFQWYSLPASAREIGEGGESP